MNIRTVLKPPTCLCYAKQNRACRIGSSVRHIEHLIRQNEGWVFEGFSFRKALNTGKNHHLIKSQVVPGSSPGRLTKISIPPLTDLLSAFLDSRRQGTSPRTLEFYSALLTPFVNSCTLTSTDINHFLSNLNCHNGKNAYYRAIRAFCNWLFRQEYIQDNPITKVDPPKMTKIILPSLTQEQVENLIDQADTSRDKCIISLFADSGMRLNELINVREGDIDWETQTIVI